MTTTSSDLSSRTATEGPWLGSFLLDKYGTNVEKTESTLKDCLRIVPTCFATAAHLSLQFKVLYVTSSSMQEEYPSNHMKRIPDMTVLHPAQPRDILREVLTNSYDVVVLSDRDLWTEHDPIAVLQLFTLVKYHTRQVILVKPEAQDHPVLQNLKTIKLL